MCRRCACSQCQWQCLGLCQRGAECCRPVACLLGVTACALPAQGVLKSCRMHGEQHYAVSRRVCVCVCVCASFMCEMLGWKQSGALELEAVAECLVSWALLHRWPLLHGCR